MKMKPILMLTIIVVSMLLVGGACGSSDYLPPPTTIPEPITVEPETDSLPLDVDVSDYPEYLDLSISIESIQNQEHFDAVMNGAVGKDLTVTLGSNPTTGAQWSEDAEISDESVVQQTSHIFIGPGIEKPPGTSGEEVWTFEALKKGTATINMEYSRPWIEEDASYRTVTITVNIRE